MPWKLPGPEKGKRKRGGWSNTEEVRGAHFTEILRGVLEVVPGGVIRARKTSYSDDVHTGFWLGADPADGYVKLNLGGSGHYLKWTGTELQLSGSILAAAGAVALDNDGLNIIAPDSYTDKNAIRWSPALGASFIARIYALLTVGRVDLMQTVGPLASKDSYWAAAAYGASGQLASLSLQAIDADSRSASLSVRRGPGDGSQAILTGYGGVKAAIVGSLAVSEADDEELDDQGVILARAGLRAGPTDDTWQLKGYTATAPAATGYVTIKINGVTYKLLAAAA